MYNIYFLVGTLFGFFLHKAVMEIDKLIKEKKNSNATDVTKGD